MILRMKLLGGALAVGLVGAFAPVAQAPIEPAVALTVSIATAPAAVEVVPLASKVTVKKFKNCKALNKKYRHGVGKKSAKDKTSGRTKPVKNFKKHNALYLRNKHLDRDRDGIACEKR